MTKINNNVFASFFHLGFDKKDNAFNRFEEAVYNWETSERGKIPNVKIVKFARDKDTRYLHYKGEDGYEKIFSVNEVIEEDRPTLY